MDTCGGQQPYAGVSCVAEFSCRAMGSPRSEASMNGAAFRPGKQKMLIRVLEG